MFADRHADSLDSVFNVQGSEIIILLLLALIVLGPEKLPDAIRRFTKFYGEAKKMSTGFQSELRNALDEPMRELQATADLVRQQVDPLREMVTQETTAEKPATSRPGQTGLPDVSDAPVMQGNRTKPVSSGLASPPTGSGPGTWLAPDAATAADPSAAPGEPDDATPEVS